MVKNNIPYVAIIGGIWELPAAEANDAKDTAKEIGKALATAGMGLVVYLSHQDSLEPYVVTGYVNALPLNAEPGLIRVRFAESQRDQVKFPEQATRPELFDVVLFPGQDWEAPFYRSLVNAEGVDAVLLLGGKTSTLIAGQIALARPLPILAIDKFDGSAKSIRTELARAAQDYPSSTTHNITQSVNWLKNKSLERAKLKQEAGEREKRYLKVNSQRKKTTWTACAFVALLTTFFFGVARTPAAVYYSAVMFGGLIAAGATGALVRSIINGSEESGPVKSLLLGSIAGFVVGLAYLIPQWIGAPGVLKPSIAVVEATDKIQFISAVLVAISAGVGFDTVFNRLRKQADDLPIGPAGK